jgi:hypothetical protein
MLNIYNHSLMSCIDAVGSGKPKTYCEFGRLFPAPIFQIPNKRKIPINILISGKIILLSCGRLVTAT